MSSIISLQDNDSGAASKTAINSNFAALNADKAEGSTTVNNKALSTNPVLTTADIADSTDKRYVTDAQRTVLGNTSGTNTGDQVVPVKASGVEVATGSDDAKFATPKAIKDSHNVPSVAPGTSGNLMSSNGTDWVSSSPSSLGFPVIAASDVLLVSADTLQDTQSVSYAKVKEVKILQTGTVRVKFDLQSLQAGGTAYGRIYKNGVAVGTERVRGSTFATYSEDISVTAQDLIQLYIHIDNASYNAQGRNFRFYGDIILPVIITN